MILRRQTLAVAALFIFFLGLRLFMLGAHDLWYDEIGTVQYAQSPWYNLNAPLYWLIMHVWIRIFGVSEFSLRLPSVVFSFAGVLLLYALGRDLFDRRTGLIAATLAGLSAFQIWYAQEARDYALLFALGLASTWSLNRALRLNKAGYWVLFGVASLLGSFSSYFFLALLAAQAAAMLIFGSRQTRRPSVIALAAVLAGFALYLPRFLAKLQFISAGFWVPKPTWSSLAITADNFLLGCHGSAMLYALGFSCVLAALLAAVWAGVRQPQLRASLFFCCWFLVPVAGVFVFSRLFFSIYLNRGLIVFSPFFYLLAAAGIAFSPRMLRSVLLAVLVLVQLSVIPRYFSDMLFTPAAYHLGTYTKKPVKPVAVFLERSVKEGDILAFTNETSVPGLAFYGYRRQPVYCFFDPAYPEPTWQRPMSEEGFCLPYARIAGLQFEKLWVLASDWGRTGDLDEHSRSVIGWLDRTMRLCSVDVFDGQFIYCYERL